MSALRQRWSGRCGPSERSPARRTRTRGPIAVCSPQRCAPVPVSPHPPELRPTLPDHLRRASGSKAAPVHRRREWCHRAPDWGDAPRSRCAPRTTWPGRHPSRKRDTVLVLRPPGTCPPGRGPGCEGRRPAARRPRECRTPPTRRCRVRHWKPASDSSPPQPQVSRRRPGRCPTSCPHRPQRSPHSRPPDRRAARFRDRSILRRTPRR